MNKLREELLELLGTEPFVPFVVTASDGFALPIPSAKRALVGNRMLVVTEENGTLHHFPFAGIAHISQAE